MALKAVLLRLQYSRNIDLSKETIYLGHFTKDDKLFKRELISPTIQPSSEDIYDAISAEKRKHVNLSSALTPSPFTNGAFLG